MRLVLEYFNPLGLTLCAKCTIYNLTTKYHSGGCQMKDLRFSKNSKGKSLLYKSDWGYKVYYCLSSSNSKAYFWPCANITKKASAMVEVWVFDHSIKTAGESCTAVTSIWDICSGVSGGNVLGSIPRNGISSHSWIRLDTFLVGSGKGLSVVCPLSERNQGFDIWHLLLVAYFWCEMCLAAGAWIYSFRLSSAFAFLCVFLLGGRGSA